MQRSRCTSVTTNLSPSSPSPPDSAAGGAACAAAGSSTVNWNAGSPLSCTRSFAARAAVSWSTAGRSAHLVGSAATAAAQWGKHITSHAATSGAVYAYCPDVHTANIAAVCQALAMAEVKEVRKCKAQYQRRFNMLQAAWLDHNDRGSAASSLLMRCAVLVTILSSYVSCAPMTR